MSGGKGERREGDGGRVQVIKQSFVHAILQIKVLDVYPSNTEETAYGAVVTHK